MADARERRKGASAVVMQPRGSARPMNARPAEHGPGLFSWTVPGSHRLNARTKSPKSCATTRLLTTANHQSSCRSQWASRVVAAW
jgi:hypothetical protein